MGNDYSIYKFYKGEEKNPFDRDRNDQFLASYFWVVEHQFESDYRNNYDKLNRDLEFISESNYKKYAEDYENAIKSKDEKKILHNWLTCLLVVRLGLMKDTSPKYFRELLMDYVNYSK
ncbi:MAG: hypothetical protein LBK94_00825 [Prevotellaceae bacterium]|jgi:hypothetical protein|nr:hypothetical protein [Prevotellaceae bacterium]